MTARRADLALRSAPPAPALRELVRALARLAAREDHDRAQQAAEMSDERVSG